MATILIVDDDECVRELLVLTLNQLGHTCVEAADGNKAIELFRLLCPDLIITDISMPDRDGIELIMDLRLEASKVPVIAISGNSKLKPLYLQMARKLGAFEVLSKPFTLDQVRSLVSSVLSAAPQPVR